MLKEASNASGSQQRGQQHHRQRKPIHANMESRVDGGVPGCLFLELEAGFARLELGPQIDRQEEGDQAQAESRPVDGFQVVLRQAQDYHRRQHGEEQDQGKEMLIDKCHRLLQSSGEFSPINELIQL